ncbi:hypothetical protein BASA61_010383 [Batrachochytrium salamandrivorans]|nr:hypothetical protein BASA61_010383 [Batrachochytrium salamandrivorans]
MRLSTGIILSILSTNVFAIEHLNGAHPSSLLARRAVVADADGVFLQKRTNGKEEEEQVRPKTFSFFSSRLGRHAHTKDLPKNDPNSNLDTGEGSTNSVAYDPNKDGEDEDKREDVHTEIVPNQEKPSFLDTLRESSSQVFGRIRQGLSRTKHEFELFFSSKHQISAVSKAVKFHFDGEKGDEIGNEVYALFLLALETSQSYQTLYLDPVESPFSLKIFSLTSNESKKRYKDLQDGLQQSIESHILSINTAIGYIRKNPNRVIAWLEKLMEAVNDFYRFILNAKSEYSDFLKDLKIPAGRYREELDKHIDAVPSV